MSRTIANGKGAGFRSRYEQIVRAVAVLVWLLPPAVLGVMAWPRLMLGAAHEAAFPVPVYLSMNVELPQRAYGSAMRILRPWASEDAAAAWAAGEASMHAGAAPADSIALLTAALHQAPALPRAWTLLAEAAAPQHAGRAAAALTVALSVARYDYWVAGRRARLAAALWEQLPERARAAALSQVRLLWQERALRSELLGLLSSPAGAAMVERAFADEPDGLRALNRWISAQRRQAGLRR